MKPIPSAPPDPRSAAFNHQSVLAFDWEPAMMTLVGQPDGGPSTHMLPL